MHEIWAVVWYLILGNFTSSASKERVSVPPDYAAEMKSYDPSIGEFTVHYAGFFDPGFGYGESGEIKGTNAVLEVRAHEVPILLEDSRDIGRLIYHRWRESANQSFMARGIGSSYQQQHLALSKQFREPMQQALRRNWSDWPHTSRSGFCCARPASTRPLQPLTLALRAHIANLDVMLRADRIGNGESAQGRARGYSLQARSRRALIFQLPDDRV